MNLILKTFKNAKWKGKDAFPAGEWEAEVEKYLAYLEMQKFLTLNLRNTYITRLNQNPKQRNKTLAEVQAAYFIEEICGNRIIEWEPKGSPGRVLEFAFKSKCGPSVVVEVKSPGWEGEIVEAQGHESPRLKQHKYIQAEARGTAPWKAVRDSIERAYVQLPNNQPSLLVINDDIFVSLVEMPECIDIALFCPKAKSGLGEGYLAEDGYFLNNRYENLGGVLCMQVQKNYGIIHYQACFYRNPNALPSCKLPKSLKFPKHRYGKGMFFRWVKFFLSKIWVRWCYRKYIKQLTQ